MEQARFDNDNDLNLQIDVFFEDQKHDEEEFLVHFDPSDNQAVCQAIQLQVCFEKTLLIIYSYIVRFLLLLVNI